MDSSLPQERRQYFRIPGVVYFRIEKKGDFLKTPEPLPEFLDSVQLKLMNFCSRLEYEAPEHLKYFKEITEIMKEMHRFREPPKSKKQWVIISGSGMDFLSSEAYAAGDKVKACITFPGYPFETLELQSEVTRCVPHDGEMRRYHVALIFEEIGERDQENLIKFVNALQRQRAAERKNG